MTEGLQIWLTRNFKLNFHFYVFKDFCLKTHFHHGLILFLPYTLWWLKVYKSDWYVTLNFHYYVFKDFCLKTHLHHGLILFLPYTLWWLKVYKPDWHVTLNFHYYVFKDFCLKTHLHHGLILFLPYTLWWLKVYKSDWHVTLNLHYYVISCPIFMKRISDFIFFQVLFIYGLKIFWLGQIINESVGKPETNNFFFHLA